MRKLRNSLTAVACGLLSAAAAAFVLAGAGSTLGDTVAPAMFWAAVGGVTGWFAAGRFGDVRGVRWAAAAVGGFACVVLLPFLAMCALSLRHSMYGDGRIGVYLALIAGSPLAVAGGCLCVAGLLPVRDRTKITDNESVD